MSPQVTLDFGMANGCFNDKEMIGPTVAAYGINAETTRIRADILVCDDFVDVHLLHSWVDRCRLAEDSEHNR